MMSEVIGLWSAVVKIVFMTMPIWLPIVLWRKRQTIWRHLFGQSSVKRISPIVVSADQIRDQPDPYFHDIMSSEAGWGADITHCPLPGWAKPGNGPATSGQRLGNDWSTSGQRPGNERATTGQPVKATIDGEEEEDIMVDTMIKLLTLFHQTGSLGETRAIESVFGCKPSSREGSAYQRIRRKVKERIAYEDTRFRVTDEQRQWRREMELE